VEKNDILGGQLLLNRFIPGKDEMVRVAEDLENNLRDQGVDILLGREADIRFISEMAPDAVVLATGAEPIEPEIPGMEDQKTVQAWDVLSGNAGVGKRVVIVGGNAVGLETALCLAGQGTLSPDALHFLMINRAEPLADLTDLLNKGNKEVTVVEMSRRVGQDIGASSRWTVTAELRRLGVTVIKKAKATGITPDGLEIQRAGAPGFLPADSVVIAVGARPRQWLINQIKGLVPEVYKVGDAIRVRNAMQAIREGFLAGLKI